MIRHLPELPSWVAVLIGASMWTDLHDHGDCEKSLLHQFWVIFYCQFHQLNSLPLSYAGIGKEPNLLQQDQ